MKPRISRISVILTAVLSLAFLPSRLYSLETPPPPTNDSTQLKVQTPPPRPKSVWMSHEATEVLKLIRAQVPEDVVMAFIENSRTGFSLTADEIVQLHNEGVTDKMIQAMLVRKKQGPQLNISVAQEPVQLPAPQQQTVVQPPTQVVTQPSVTYVQSEPVYVGAPTTYVYRYPYYSYYDSYPYWGSYWYPGVSFNFGFGHYYGGYRYNRFAPSYHYSGHFAGGFHGGYRGGFGGRHR